MWQQLIQWLFCDLIRWLFCEAITFFSLLTLSLYFTSSKSLSISHHQNLNVLAYVLKKCKTTNQTNHNFKTPTIPTNNMQHRHRSHQQKETRRASHWDISTNTGSASRLWLSPQLESAHESADNGVKQRKRNYHHGVVPTRVGCNRRGGNQPGQGKLVMSPLSASHARPRNAIKAMAANCWTAGAHDDEAYGSEQMGGGGSVISAAFLPSVAWRDGEQRQLCRLGVVLLQIWSGFQLGVFTGLTERGEGVRTTYHLPFFRAWFYLFQSSS